MELLQRTRRSSISTPSIEPWLGFYFDIERRPRSALQLRPAREPCWPPEGAEPAAATTAVSTCGANPGMVSWFVKQALLDIAR